MLLKYGEKAARAYCISVCHGVEAAAGGNPPVRQRRQCPGPAAPQAPALKATGTARGLHGPAENKAGLLVRGSSAQGAQLCHCSASFFFPHYQAFHPGEQRTQESTSSASSLLGSAACPRFWPPAWCSDFSPGCRRYPQQTSRTYSGQAREVSELPVLHPAAAQQSPARPSRTNHRLSAAHNRTRRPLPKRFSFKKVRKERYCQQPACAR